MNELSGQTLGQYELIEIIGRGGMATVYRAYQRSMGRDVAVKVIAPELAEEGEFLTRFEQEARIIAALSHPNILDVHDFGRERGITYLVMRLMTGGSLKDELRAGPMPVERVIDVVEQIASALDYAHARGIVHRDLKPSNVLLDADRRVALTDFGIAKMIGGSPLTGLTQGGSVMGTPKYMAPEQWRAEPIDGRADQYALGVLAYQMLAGEVPFSAETPHSLMYLHLDREPPPLQVIRPGLPAGFEPAIRRAMAKRPEQRFGSAGAFAAALAEAYNSPDEQATRSVTWENRPMYPIRPPQEQPLIDLSTRRDPPRRPNPASDRSIQPSRSVAREATPLPPSAPPEPTITPSQESSRPVHQPYQEPPYIPSYQPPPARRSAPRHDPRGIAPRPRQEEAGIGRFFAVFAGVILALGIFIGVVFAIALITSSGNNPSDDEPTVHPATTTPTEIPAGLRPVVQIGAPASISTVPLGTTVLIQFTVTGEQPITRVELRRFNITIDSQPANGAFTYSGTFSYTVNTTDPHVLEVVPWSGSIEGVPARVTISAQ